MRLMSGLRLTVALFICPALRVHNGPGAAKALDLPGNWMRFGAKGATAQAEAADVVEVQVEMAGLWMPGRLINGELHWVQPKPEAADLEAICVVYERANHKVPVAIAALRSRVGPPVAGEETRLSSQTLPDGALNADAANSCFRLLQSAPQGGL